MGKRDHTKQLAQRVEDLLADIRAEIEDASASLALQAVGVLTFLEEAASLLKHAGLRMGWIPGGEPSAADEEPEGVLSGEDVYAAFRYVAVQAPSLAPALAWAAASCPEVVAILGATPPASGELAALASLDGVLGAIVRASPAGFRRSGQPWRKPGGANGTEEPLDDAPAGSPCLTASDVARSVRKVAQIRPALVPACLWLIQHRPATRLAVGAYLPKPEELSELSEVAREVEEAERGEAGSATGPFEIAEAEAQESLASLAVKLAESRAMAQGLITGLDREWPSSMLDGALPPDLAFSLFGAAETVEELLDEAIEWARSAADATAESIRSDWEARHQISTAERMAELLSGYAETAESGEVAADVKTRVLPEVVEILNRSKKTVLAARSRLPPHYPELAGGEPSREAVLHGDLGILVGALDEAISRAQTAVSGVLQE